MASAPTASSGCGCRATSSRRGPASRPIRRRRSRPTSFARRRLRRRGARLDLLVREDPPDFHEPTGFNIDLAADGRRRRRRPGGPPGLDRRCRPGRMGARRLRRPARCDGVEMTRAQIADPDLVAKIRAETSERDPAVHPLQPDVPGARRPEPDRHVRRRADVRTRDRGPRLVRRWRPDHDGSSSSGAASPGLETARVAAARGHDVSLFEAAEALGGVAAVAGPNGPFVDWLAAEVRGAGVVVTTGSTVTGAELDGFDAVVQCTGARAGRRRVRRR